MNYLTVEHRDGIAYIGLDMPGENVNKLNEQLISEFSEALNTIRDARDIKGAIIYSLKKDNFIAGADLNMLTSKQSGEEVEQLSRDGNALLKRLAECDKPVVAAIHGSAMGGGLEVPLACHYRVASNHSKTVMGQPEVQLGLLPGAGGTQRLPRLIGIQNALTYMLTGKSIYPVKAKKIGLVDELVHKDALLTAARKAVDRLSHPKSYRRKDRLPLTQKLLEGNPLGRKIIFSQSRKRTLKQTKGNYPAPFKIIEALEEGYKKGFEAGLVFESRAFGQLAMTGESRNLVRLFFGMQEAKKNPYPKLPRPVRKIGILGGGLMGSGIADISVNNGYRVLLKDQTLEQAAKGTKSIWEGLEKKRKKGILTSFERDRIAGLARGVENYSGFDTTDLVIEAVFEDLELKRTIVAETEKQMPPHAIFASNTSSLPITQIAEAAARPGQVIGMHYFSPVPKMPLVEIVKTEYTADWVTATAYEVGVSQGKTAILVNDGPGFYTTRILAPFLNEAMFLIDEGASFERIDQAMKQFGFPVGPIALLDEVGIDVAAHVSEVMAPLFKQRGLTPHNKARELLDAGYQGRKNNRGFYKYRAGKKSGKNKKEANTQIYRYFEGGGQNNISSQTIQHRMALAMLNEAAYCLQQSILRNPVDGDLGAILGLGFPPFLGGPFRYMDRCGIRSIYEQLGELAQTYGARFQPAGIIQQYAESGKQFHST